MGTNNKADAARLDAISRLDLALGALDAVKELCNEAAGAQRGLHCVDGDNLACLLGLIINEMRSTSDLL